MVLLKCLCVLSIIANSYEQLIGSGAACSKGRCEYIDDCPIFRRGVVCGSDRNYTILYCCTSIATTKVLGYSISREFPDRTQCGRRIDSLKIYNGYATEIGEYPWVAALLYVATKNTMYGGVKCGGTLITEKFVLTAAHCVIGQTAESIRVLLGDWNITSDPDPYPAGQCKSSRCTAKIEYADKVINATIDKIISHEMYSLETKRNDVALLRLKTPVYFTDFVRPICLPSQDFLGSGSENEVVVAGWGITQNGSDILKKAKLHVLTNNECLIKIKQTGEIHETEFCTANVDSDACWGDSGGPIMSSHRDYLHNWFQLGIVGSGGSCEIGATATVYTRVSSFVDWIIDQITPQSERDSPCTTPDNKNGSCVQVSQCPVLEQQYLQPGGRSGGELIRRSLCGFHLENRTDMVCCRLSEIKKECKTPKPESKDGRCVRITNCPALKNTSKAAREDIQKYQCGFDDELLVCCKTQDIVVASEPDLEEFSGANIPNRTSCGRIRNNNTKSEYPWLAALIYYPANPCGRSYLSCGGSLINNRFVLTAASCVDAEHILNHRVLLGTGIVDLLDCHKTSGCPGSMLNLTVVEAILHPFYNSSYNLNDIALVRLGSYVVFNDYISAVCLPPPNLQPLRRGSEVTVAGWASELRRNARNSKAYLWDAQSCIENPVSKTIHKQELCISTNKTTVKFCSPVWGGSIVRAYKDDLGQNLFLEGIDLGSGNCINIVFYPYSTNVRISAYTSWILRIITNYT